MARRSRSVPSLAAVVMAVVALAGAGCSDDDGGDEAVDGTTTTAADDGAEEGGEEERTTPPTGPGTGDEVVVETFIFRPDPLTVPGGTEITVTNLDRTTHTFTAGTREAPMRRRFDESLAPGGSATVTLDEAGTVDYFCRIHGGDGMTGQLIVE